LFLYGRKGKWINILHDFNFKIVHHPSFKHTNANVLNKNLVDGVDDDDFQKEIQDYGWMQPLCDVGKML
jgi:hypothetical protein